MGDPALRDPERIGPYEILGTLGRGGMGIVYRARHAESGAMAALKTVRVAEPDLLGGIQREIEALAALSHPGVVRIIDDGVQDGIPWCAMELLEGQTLRDLMPFAGAQASTVVLHPPVDPGARTRRLERGHGDGTGARFVDGAAPAAAPWTGPGPALAVVRQLCQTLAYLHGEGIVHRDLKPENVVIRPGGQPVLIDFGLTQRLPADLAREPLLVPGDVLGTAAYMSPEQIRGEVLDARSDLYALGCVLFESVAGFPPFHAPSVGHILHGHLSEEPPRLADVVSGVPPDLDAMVGRLLAKDRRQRALRAAAVEEMLGRLGTPGSSPATERAPRLYLYRPGLVGRSAERARLLEMLARPAPESAVVLLRGESGIGKTRLAVEVAAALRDAGHVVLTAACMPDAPPLSPLRSLLQALARHVRDHGAGEDGELPRAGLRLLVRYEPALRQIPELEESTEPAMDAADRRRLLLATLVSACAVVAAERPLLLVLDDLQWADDLTHGFVQALSGREPTGGQRVAVLATVRSGEASDALEALCGHGATTTFDLGGFDRGALAGMVEEMLASSVEATFVDRLAAQSGGNPFFVAELLAEAVASGDLADDGHGALHAARGARLSDALVPAPSIEDVLARRLQRLPSGAREAAEMASVLVREVSTKLLTASLQAASGLDARGCREAIRTLLWRHVLEEPLPGRLCFSHDKLREVAYGSIDSARRAHLHRHAACAIDALAPYRRAEHLGALPRHWQLAGDLERARSAHLEAARAMAAKHGFAEAGAHYEAYLALSPDGAPETPVRLELAQDVLVPSGRMLQAMAELERVVSAGGDGVPVRSALTTLGELAWRTGDVARAESVLGDALARHRLTGDRAGEGRALRLLARVAYGKGRFDVADELGTAALAIHQAMDDSGQVGLALAELAGARHAAGRAVEAADLYRRALAIFRSAGNLRGEAMALGNLASLSWDAEDGDVERWTAAALAAARRCGDRSLEGFLLGGQGVIAWSVGDLALSADLFTRSLRIAREAADRRQEALLLRNLGAIAQGQGRPDEARRLFEESLAIHLRLEDREGEADLRESLRRLAHR